MWQKVKFADECCKCDCCNEPWCAEHDAHYFECECIAPTEDDVEYDERDGELWARRI